MENCKVEFISNTGQKIVIDFSLDEKGNFFNLSVYYLGNDELEKPYLEEVRKLRQEKKDKVAQIILGLELGETTKKELTDILGKVEF